MRLTAWLVARATPRAFWVLGVLAVGMLLYLNLTTLPGSIAWFRELSGGATVLDIRWHYDAAEAYEELTALGAAGRANYLLLLWSVDLMFPALVASWLAVAMVRAAGARGSTRGQTTLLLGLPIAAALADYTENLAITTLLLAFPDRLDTLARVAGNITSAKFLLYVLAVAAPLAARWHRRLGRP